MKKLTLLALALLFLSACDQASPKRMPEIQFQDVVSHSYPGFSEFKSNQQVDILFVIDNSNSMVEEQQNLSRNMNRFVEAFGNNNAIDFHIGVVSVYDSVKFSTEDYIKKFADQRPKQGELLPLKGLPNSATNNRRFVDPSTPDYVNVLKKSLDIGTISPNDGGPRWEESFSPVVAALSDEMLSGPNKGFYRPEAHLAIIFVTDAEDQSPDLEPGQLDQFLRQLKRDKERRRFSTFGVISPTEAKNQCFKDFDVKGQDPLDPLRIEEFLRITRGLKLSLCGIEFGEKLSTIGKEIKKRIMYKEFFLNHRPDELANLCPAVDDDGKITSGQVGPNDLCGDPETGDTIDPAPIVVAYGDQVIAPGDWVYDPDKVSVVLTGNANLELVKEARISIRYVPADLTNVINGRTQRVDQQ